MKKYLIYINYADVIMLSLIGLFIAGLLFICLVAQSSRTIEISCWLFIGLMAVTFLYVCMLHNKLDAWCRRRRQEMEKKEATPQLIIENYHKIVGTN